MIKVRHCSSKTRKRLFDAMDLNALGAVPVLPFQSGVCGLCHYWAALGQMYCDSCVSSCATYEFEVNPNKPMVRPSNSDTSKVAVGLQMFLRANSKSDAYKYGWQYKSKSVDVSLTDHQQSQLFISQLLEFGLLHEPCLARKLGIGQQKFDVITWVPSKVIEAPEHELGKILKNSSVKSRARSLLAFDSKGQTRVAGSERVRFNWVVPLDSNSIPESVLLIDDMWTSGETMLSATAALFRAGISRVGMLALGRHVNRFGRYYSPDGIYESFVRDQAIDTRLCAFCDARSNMRPNPPLAEQYGHSPEKHKVELFRLKVEADPDWSATPKWLGFELVGSEVWCKEFKYGTVVEYFPADDSVQIDFGIFRKRRFPINHPALRWKPHSP